MSILKVGMVQQSCTTDIKANIAKLTENICECAAKGAKLVVLQELHNSVYFCQTEDASLCDLAETIPGPSTEYFGDLAKRLGIVLVLSLFEKRAPGLYHNTAVVIEKDGSIAGKYRKMHMFDIDVEGGQYYSESSVITAGDEVCVVETEFGPIGVAICYDVRFPELFRLLAKRGAKAVVMPASFNRTTGPAHWELLMRARALDQEMYVLGCAAAGDLAGSYNGWGHSIAVDPWGSIMEELGEGPGMLMAAVDFAKADAVRSQIPVLQQLRTDIYEVCEKTVG